MAILDGIRKTLIVVMGFAVHNFVYPKQRPLPSQMCEDRQCQAYLTSIPIGFDLVPALVELDARPRPVPKTKVGA